MLWLLHHLIIALYLLLPLAAVVLEILPRQKTTATPVMALRNQRLSVSILAGSLTGIAVCVVYAVNINGRLRLGQTLIAAYLGISLLCLLRYFDLLLQISLPRIFRLGLVGDQRPSLAWMWRWRLATIVRTIILFAIGLPYMMGAILTFRPGVDMAPDPALARASPQPVWFDSTDGFRLSGLWIAAAPWPPNAPQPPPPDWGRETVILCHGLAADKTTQWSLVRDLPAAGYNVLTFDFRGYGGSEGLQTTFGVLEKNDVLGAVRWIRINRPKETRRILGVGASAGGAALIAAAADSGPDGQAIDAVAVIGCYDSLNLWMRSISNAYFLRPLNWLAMKIGVPMACAQTGADLRHFSPAELLNQVAPRPVLVIHALRDRIVRIDRGTELFDAASAPKSYLWLDMESDEAVRSPAAAEAVRRFFDTAQPMI